jgi:hypothetical protein
MHFSNADTTQEIEPNCSKLSGWPDLADPFFPALFVFGFGLDVAAFLGATFFATFLGFVVAAVTFRLDPEAGLQVFGRIPILKA